MTILIGSPVYSIWDPTARQEVEPDTTYLMDLDVEVGLTPITGGMIGANEVSGLAADRPPWRGGSKVARVAGRYRDGLRALGTSNNFLYRPSTGILPADQWTIEFQMMSAVPWASLVNVIPFRIWNDFLQYIQVRINGTAIVPSYRHDQDPSGFIDKTISSTGHPIAADTWTSVALTYLAGTMRQYLDGVASGSVAGCPAPRYWDDYWANGSGIAVSVESPDLTVSDLRISRLCRVPGARPA